MEEVPNVCQLTPTPPHLHKQRESRLNHLFEEKREIHQLRPLITPKEKITVKLKYNKTFKGA